MAIGDVFADLSVEKKEKKAADKKYVSFSLEEWRKLEAKQGAEINPVDIKKMVIGIFEGKYSISVVKKPA